ncbi:hypothetical protein IAT40_000281 [Kwoniella sp. CBS 6097]
MPRRKHSSSNVKFDWTPEMELRLVQSLHTKPRFRSLLKTPFEKTEARKWVLLQELCTTILNKSGLEANEQWVNAAIVAGSLRRNLADGTLTPTESWAPVLGDPVERKIKSLHKTYEAHKEKLEHLSSFDEVSVGLRGHLQSLSPYHFHFEAIFNSAGRPRDVSPNTTLLSSAQPLPSALAHPNQRATKPATLFEQELGVQEESEPHIKSVHPSPDELHHLNANLNLYAAVSTTSSDAFDVLAKACEKELLDESSIDKRPDSGLSYAAAWPSASLGQVPRPSKDIIDLTMDSDTEADGHTGMNQAFPVHPQTEELETTSAAVGSRRSFADLASLSPAPEIPDPLFSPIRAASVTILHPYPPITAISPKLLPPGESIQEWPSPLSHSQPRWKTCSSPASQRIILSPDSDTSDLPDEESPESHDSRLAAMIALEEIDELDESESETEIVVKLEAPALPTQRKTSGAERLGRGKPSQTSGADLTIGALQLVIEQLGPPHSRLIQQRTDVDHAVNVRHPDEVVKESSKGKRIARTQEAPPKRRRLTVEVELSPARNRHLYTRLRLAGDENESPMSANPRKPAEASETNLELGLRADSISSPGRREAMIAEPEITAAHGADDPLVPSSDHGAHLSSNHPVEPDVRANIQGSAFKANGSAVGLQQEGQDMSPADRHDEPDGTYHFQSLEQLRPRKSEASPVPSKKVTFAVPSPTIVKVEHEETVYDNPQDMLHKARSAVFERSWLREATTKALSSRKLKRKVEKERCRLYAYGLTKTMASEEIKCMNGWSVMIEPVVLASSAMGKRARMVSKLVGLAGGTCVATFVELGQRNNPSRRIVVGLGDTPVKLENGVMSHHPIPTDWQYMSILSFLQLIDTAYTRASARLTEREMGEGMLSVVPGGVASQPGAYDTEHERAYERRPVRGAGLQPAASCDAITTGETRRLPTTTLRDSIATTPYQQLSGETSLRIAPRARMPAGEIAILLRMGRSERMNGDWNLEDMLVYEREKAKSAQLGRVFLERKRADCLSKAYFELQAIWIEKSDFLRDCHFMQLAGDDVRHIRRDSKLSSFIKSAGGYHPKRFGFADSGPHVARHIVVSDQRWLHSRWHVVMADSHAARMITELELLLWMDKRYRENDLIPFEVERLV